MTAAGCQPAAIILEVCRVSLVQGDEMLPHRDGDLVD